MFSERFVPFDQVRHELAENKINKVHMGNLMMLCYYGNPRPKDWSYCLTGIAHLDPREIF